MSVNKRIEELRKLMDKNKLDLYIIPTSDPHNSEYLADVFKTREFITGFTGSAGLALVTKDRALLWTDGRYFIQAEREIKDSEFELMKMGIAGYPTYEEWIREYIKPNSKIGFDGRMFSQGEFEKLAGKLIDKKIDYITDLDLIGEIWKDRPEYPKSQAFIHELKYTGKSSLEKLGEVRQMMKMDGVDYFLISSLDDIAWLYNIRARDVLSNPVLISYALVTMEEAYLFTDEDKIDREVREFLQEGKIEILPYEGLVEKIQKFEKDKKVYLEKEKINRFVYSNLPEYVKVKSGINYTTSLKAYKNQVEIKNQRNAYIKDGVALTKFFYWLDKNLDREEITEISASNKLLEFRRMQDGFIEPSFATIAAYKDNAAMMHYSADETSNRVLKREGLFLVDSGGQYLDGTTDTTRTLVLGELSSEEIHDFTLTFKGHTNLMTAKFLEGSTGHYLDVLSRIPLWKEGIDYKCGTGHGIGFLLNVHEGPHRISPAENSIALQEGMITSIEPGVYKSGEYGIRLENIAVVKKDVKTEFGQFLSFETLSFVPIDLEGLDIDMISKEELDWLNSYHEQVYKKLSPFLSDDERQWLEIKTRQITKED